MKISFNFLVNIALLSTAVMAAANEDYLAYGIPAEAKKIGPHATRDPDKQEYLYFAPGAEVSRENLIAIELFDQGVLVKRDLLRHGRKHGMQREWHPNGKPKLESPYRNGSMEGTFKGWSENGHLISQYAISGGTGTAKVYDTAGRLVTEDHYRNNQRDGLRMERIAHLISLTWSKDGNLRGKGYGFFEDGGLAAITFFSDNGEPLGPAVEFSREGAMSKRAWYLNNREVSEMEYAAAAAGNPGLPPYHADASHYKQMVGEDVRALLGKYRALPRVKIPLQFDQQGNPVIAE